ncbi:MAG: hypothetical protein H7X85_02185 [Thermoanaerobaculia bacterium]|nr:hypothetical protein [Thermoanaerobaculia bacterium]
MSDAMYRETQSFPPWVWLIALVGAVVLVGILTMRLSTSVTREAITVRYGPLYTARVPLSEITQAEAIAYRPIRDYGGWGIRGTRKHRALNARGDLGVLLTRKDGTTVLIGSAKPRELLEALRSAGVTTEDKLPIVAKQF